MVIIPATTLYTPKSVTPNTFKTTLEVYNPITIVHIIRKYNINVFLAILLLSSLNFCPIFHNKYTRFLTKRYILLLSKTLFTSHVILNLMQL